MGGDSGNQEPSQASARPHVLLLCSPCMGHLIPFAELARRLVADHGLAATLLFAAATDAPSEQYAALAASVPDGVELVVLPAPPADALPPSTPVRDRVVHAAVSAVPHVRAIARSLTSSAPLAALVVDMASVPARDVATELGVPCYMFFTSPRMLLSLFLHLPELDAGLVGEYRDATEPIRLPGCVPIHARELPGSLLADRSSETYAGFLSFAKDAARVDGILVNTFGEVEPAVGQGGADRVKDMPVHAVGPLVWTRPVAVGVNREPEHARLFAWLDQQPRGSVVFLSFGSGGTLTWRQTTELALALEATGRPFIWAAKRPHEDTADGAFFGTGRGGDDDDDPLGFLPRGFVERTAGVGRVLLSWAPQTAILAHAAVGCFVTHCGWNSSLESILNGVPMVAWPLYAEQKMNAAMLETHAGVAARVNGAGPAGDGFVCREEIVSVIRRVMDGEEATTMRRRVGELRDRATHALAMDGSSTLTLAKVIFRATSWIRTWSLLSHAEFRELMVTGCNRWEMVARVIFNRFGWHANNRLEAGGSVPPSPEKNVHDDMQTDAGKVVGIAGGDTDDCWTEMRTNRASLGLDVSQGHVRRRRVELETLRQGKEEGSELGRESGQ